MSDLYRQCGEQTDALRNDAEITELLNDQLLQSKVHLYAARFQAQEQQRKIEQHREATRRNHILAQQITEAVEYKELYKELKRSLETTPAQQDVPQDNAQEEGTPSTKRAHRCRFCPRKWP